MNNKSIKIAVGAIILYEGKILLCKSAGKWGNKWLIPGGKMQFGEKIKDTIIREINEETGLDIVVKKISSARSIVNPKEYQEKNIHFLLIDVIAESKTDTVTLDQEHSEYLWVTPQKALTMDLLKYSRAPIERFIEENKQEDYLEGWKRCKADFENLRNKMEQKIVENRRKEQNNLILEMLPILDNFNLAADHVPAEDTNKPWVEGIFYIKKQFEDFLKSLDIEELTCETNDEFDPSCHDCIEQVKTKEKQSKGCVIQVLQKGYKRGEDIIRPAKVKVGK